MKRRPIQFPLLYKKALRAHLEQGRKAGLESALGLGSQALAAGMLTLDLAKLHEKNEDQRAHPDHQGHREKVGVGGH